jgi:hypothetical protein
MAKISKKHLFVLFALRRYLEKVNLKFSDKPLHASVSKIAFIKLLKDSKIIDKSERGLYLNLEILGKKKLIQYENKFLKITEKGLKKADELENEIKPYLVLIEEIEKVKSKSAQSYFT